MSNATTGMTYTEKSAFASDGLPDPRFSNDEQTETPVLPEIKRVKKTRKTQRKKKSTLKARKVGKKRLRRS
jgi:hypothetical protein